MTFDDCLDQMSSKREDCTDKADGKEVAKKSVTHGEED